MRHFKHGSSRKQKRIDCEIVHDMEEQHVNDHAVHKFKKKPYECTEVDETIWEKLKSC